MLDIIDSSTVFTYLWVSVGYTSVQYTMLVAWYRQTLPCAMAPECDVAILQTLDSRPVFGQVSVGKLQDPLQERPQVTRFPRTSEEGRLELMLRKQVG